MRFERPAFAGLVLVHPERASDSRGHFMRTFCEDEFSRESLEAHFPQTSLSFNTKAGTVRGMHFQRDPYAETKRARCSRGAILDAVIDRRPSEPIFRHWCGFELNVRWPQPVTVLSDRDGAWPLLGPV